MDHSYSLKFKVGEEGIPTVSDLCSLENSPFSQPVSKGVGLVRDMIRANEEAKEHTVRKDDGKHQDTFVIKKQIRNNIVAFLGERGSGKSSCMLTVVNKLLNMNDRYNMPYKDSVEVFDVIDPSFFDSSHNITDIFIGEFFKKYKLQAKDYNDQSEVKRQVLKKLQSEFKEMKKALGYLCTNHSEDPLDDIDALSSLSSGVGLGLSLSKLVNSYLDYLGKKTLILVIDDLDLNLESSYRMMEEIRRYLVLPNVVILLGAKLKQLKLGISYTYTKYRNENLLSSYDIDEMAIRYLDKFIPATARVFMPDPDNILNSRLEVEAGGYTDEYDSVALAVPTLIYRKTRFLFYNHDGIPSLIIPRNLREIRMLMSALTIMEDPNDSDPRIHISNKSFFQEIFP